MEDILGVGQEEEEKKNSRFQWQTNGT